MQWVLIVLFMCLSESAWANHAIDTDGKDIDLSGLTSATKLLVPELEGMHQQFDTVVFRRLEGEFTDAEVVFLQQVFTDHDAEESRQRSEPIDIPIEQLPGIAAAAALAGMGGRKLFLRVREKRGAA